MQDVRIVLNPGGGDEECSGIKTIEPRAHEVGQNSALP